MTEQAMIGIGTLVFAGIALVLLVRVLERNAIQNGKDALSGRHMGVSLALLLSVLALAGIIFAVTGCIPGAMYIWIGIAGALWAIHGIYALVNSRG